MPIDRGKARATTFWMEEEIKNKAKEKAHQLNKTLTDLINDAVSYYVENIEKIDPRAQMQQLGEEIRSVSKITQLEEEVERLKISVTNLANQENQQINEIESLRNQIIELQRNLSGDYLRSQIQIHLSSQVGPTLEAISNAFARLSSTNQ